MQRCQFCCAIIDDDDEKMGTHMHITVENETIVMFWECDRCETKRRVIEAL